MKFKNKRSILSILGFIFILYFILNLNVSITQGIDGQLRIIRMPLYVKAAEFLARHYEYERIVKEITSSCRNDEEKVLAIFNWTHENIRKMPQGLPVVDDHVLNIIIRGYGETDQYQDVFTTLCAYCGIPAFWDKVYSGKKDNWYPISFVKYGGSWHVFDPYNGVYFLNREHEIASLNEIVEDRSIVDLRLDGNDLVWQGTPYKEFYYNLKPISGNKTYRPYKQMPFRRLIYETKKLFKLEK